MPRNLIRLTAYIGTFLLVAQNAFQLNFIGDAEPPRLNFLQLSIALFLVASITMALSKDIYLLLNKETKKSYVEAEGKEIAKIDRHINSPMREILLFLWDVSVASWFTLLLVFILVALA